MRSSRVSTSKLILETKFGDNYVIDILVSCILYVKRRLQHGNQKSILPVLTYDTETMSLTQEQTRNLKVCQRRMERSILGITLRDKKRNTEMRQRTRIKDVGEEVWMKKCEWPGHVARMSPQKWKKLSLCYEWYPRDGV
uniref:Uncharacterized protein n=1 Tax=Cacopsylla melanoneura TaxID=428564 RepID=A0A8D9DYI0_9HEMI